MSLPAYKTDPRDQTPADLDERTSFEAFWNRNRGVIRMVAQRALASGSLEEEDLMSETWLVWDAHRNRWNPDQSRFTSYIMSMLRFSLHDSHPSLVRASEIETEGLENGGKNGELVSLAEHGDADFSPMRGCANALANVLTTHPAWYHRKYRMILEHMQQPHAARDGSLCQCLGEKLSVSERRCRQLIAEVQQILAEPDLLRDYQLPVADPMPIDLASPLRYVSFAEVIPPEIGLRQRYHDTRRMARSLRTENRFLTPLVLDQHYRIIDGWVRFSAAAMLKVPSVPALIAPIRDSLSEQYDDHRFWEMRRRIAGRTRSREPRPSGQLRLF